MRRFVAIWATLALAALGFRAIVNSSWPPPPRARVVLEPNLKAHPPEGTFRLSVDTAVFPDALGITVEGSVAEPVQVEMIPIGSGLSRVVAIWPSLKGMASVRVRLKDVPAFAKGYLVRAKSPDGYWRQEWVPVS